MVASVGRTSWARFWLSLRTLAGSTGCFLHPSQTCLDIDAEELAQPLIAILDLQNFGARELESHLNFRINGLMRGVKTVSDGTFGLSQTNIGKAQALLCLLQQFRVHRVRGPLQGLSRRHDRWSNRDCAPAASGLMCAAR